MPLLGAAMLAVAGCNCDNTEMVDAGGNVPDAAVPVDAFVPVAEITITPAFQDYGDVVVGQTSTAATFTVENVGTGATGRLSATLGGASAADFRFMANGCAGMTLAAGDTCTVSVEFRPGSEGSSSGTLTVGDSDIEAVATLAGNGARNAGLAISPTPYNFGDAIIGTPTAPHEFTVTNTGDAVSGTIAISVSGLDATQFELGADACSGNTIAAGASCTVEVIYNPSMSGTHSGSLVATGSPGGSTMAALQGRAASAAGLRLLPLSQDFGTVVSGSSSSTVDFTLTNTGGVATSTISHSFTGANASEFSVTSSTCAGAPLAGGASCTITVRFNAAASGSKTASLDVTDGTLNAVASLTAISVDPGSIVIEPSTRDYGSSSIGSATGATTFTVRNPGGAPTGSLTVAVAGTNPADFPIVSGGDGCSGAALPAGGSCTIAVQFNPTASGARSATLRVQHTGGTATAALTGNGEAPAVIVVAPTAADFGSVAAGLNGANVSFTVSNTGGAASGVPAVTLTGVQSTQFNIVSNGCSASIPGGGSCTVVVRFSPTATGSKTAVLNVAATPGGTDTADLSGIGITPVALTLAPSTASFGNVAETSNAVRSFTVSNTGMETVTALTSAISAGGAEFTILPSSTCGATLAGMSSCQIDVQFAPNQGSTTTAGTLTVTGTPGGTLTAALSATPIPDLLITPPATNNFTASNGGTGVIIGANTTNTYTITNQTGRALTAFTVASPTGVMEFTRSGGTCGATLAIGASCTVIVQFTPTGTAGARSVNLTVTASGGATETAAITGTARGALRFTSWQMTTPVDTSNNFAVPPTAAAFGNRAIGGRYELDLVVTNEGPANVALVRTSSTFTGDMNLQSEGRAANAMLTPPAAQNPCTGRAINAGQTCTIRVRYYPQTTAASSGSVTVSDGTNSSVANITGTGIVGASINLTGSGDFGTVIATATADRTYTVTNPGAVATGNLSFSVTGARYSLNGGTCVAGSPVAAGASCTIIVRFSPVVTDPTGSSSPQTGLLTVNAGVTRTQALTGVVSSQLTLTPATASFTTGAGTTSATQRFTVRNVGAATTGSIVVALGSFASEFPITNNTCSTLAAGATCTFDVAFAPPGTADRTGVELHVSNGGYAAGTARVAVSTLSGDAQSPASLQTAFVTGTGHSFSPPWARFQFGYVIEGANSDSFTFTVRNVGDLASGPLTVSLTDRNNPFPPGTPTDDFDILSSTCAGAPLAAGGTCTVTARFSPPVGTGPFFRFAALEITGAPGGTAIYYLSGGSVTASPLPSVTVTPTPVSFGSAVGGVASAPQTYTVTNNTGSDLTIGTLQTCVSGGCGAIPSNPNGDSDRFFIQSVGTCTNGAVLAGGASCTFQVRYQPPVGGPFGFDQAEIRVNNSSAFLGRGTVNGTSLRPTGLSVSPTPYNFGNVVAGQVGTRSFTVANTGDVTTTAAPSAVIGGADPSQFVIVNNTCTTPLTGVGTGSSNQCTFDVEFRPAGAGARSSTLSVSAGAVSAGAVALTGNGIGAALLGISPSAPQTCADHAAGTGALDFAVCTTYTVSNGGGSPSPALSIAVTNDFRIQDNSTCVGGSGTGIGVSSVTGISLGTGASCTVIVQHTPQNVGADSGTLTVGGSGITSVTGTISSNGIASFQHTATAPGAYTQGTVNFGSIAVGSVSFANDQQLTFVNRTDPTTGVLTYTITGANAADFDMVSDGLSGGTAPRLGGGAMQVRFVPSATGARTATLTVTDGTPEHTVAVTLNGTGT